MKQLTIFLLLFLHFASASITNGQNDTNGTIKGTIEARGVRDARDVIVYLEKVDGMFEPPAENPVIDQINLIFIPHILPVIVGTTVEFTNSDNVRHNVFSPSKAKKFNLGTYASGVSREVTFEKPGIITILCNVHQEMSAYIVVLENPYYSVTGPEGTFALEDVPPGEYTVMTWHEKLKKTKQTVTVNSGETSIVNFKLSR